MKVAVVIQRYGTDVVGGAEQLCRAIVERMGNRHAVEVLTTCARDHRTWANHYRPGTERINGAVVHRFPTARQRHADFDRFTADWYQHPHTREEELDWLRQQGPDCPALLERLSAWRDRYDAFVFYTYLYVPTVLGLPLVADRSVLVPTAHDEPPIRLHLFRDLFTQPQFIVYLTRAERRFVQGRFANSAIPGTVAAMGIEMPTEPRPDRFRGCYAVHDEYLLYAGRIEGGKGCAELVDWFLRFRRDWGRPLKLVMLGRAAMPMPQHDDILYPGFVPEPDKVDALAGATAVVIPSPFESLSILALEAWALGKPVLANGACAVLEDQCLASNAGLPYQGYEEFAECLRRLLEEPALRQALGGNGRRYVGLNYNWNAVEARYDHALRLAAGR